MFKKVAIEVAKKTLVPLCQMFAERSEKKYQEKIDAFLKAKEEKITSIDTSLERKDIDTVTTDLKDLIETYNEIHLGAISFLSEESPQNLLDVYIESISATNAYYFSIDNLNEINYVLLEEAAEIITNDKSISDLDLLIPLHPREDICEMIIDRAAEQDLEKTISTLELIFDVRISFHNPLHPLFKRKLNDLNVQKIMNTPTSDF